MKTLLAALAATTALAGAATAQETVTIGIFGNPTPMQTAIASGAFEEATGWDIEWRKFASGTDVIAAMASGDIQISELGSSPLAIAASQGVDLQMIGLAQVIGDAESLIVSDASGITDVSGLAGKRIAVPVGSTAHFSLMGALDHGGVAETDLTIMNMPPDQIAAAWEQDALDGAFIWNPVQAQLMGDGGTRLVSAAETAEWGYPTFDAWVMDRAWGEANMDGVAAFLATVDKANAEYLADPAGYSAGDAAQTIASETGADAAQIPAILEGFTFVPLADQTSETWLGGSMAPAMKSTAEFLKAAGRIDTVGDDYSQFVNTGPLEAAQGM